MIRNDTDASTSGSESRRRDRSALRRRAFRTLVVALAIGTVAGTAALGSVGAASTDSASSGTEPTLVVSDATVEPDSTAGLRVSLTDVPDGLAGFKLTLAVDDGDVATVANASYPDHFGLTTDPDVSADGETVTVEAADLDDEIAAGATNVTLATIDVAGGDDGQTDLRVTSMQVDDDDGSAIDPSLEAGTLTIGDDTPETTPGTGDEGSDPNGSESDGPDSGSDGDGSESDGNGSESDGNSSPSDDDSGSNADDSESDDDAESVPGFAVGPALAALAALVAAVLAKLR
ncbi:hypothetical protein [Haloterrigena salinisoli]|uniref:hypothetical protein n=1 Tax=Haloterrigena salinisoli TaxID=3132747 RepID=UPI0030D36E3E